MLKELDGAGLAASVTDTFMMPAVTNPGSGKVTIMNPNLEPGNLLFELRKSDGTPRGTAARTIAGNGALVADIAGDLFADVTPDPTDYIYARSNTGLLPFEILGTPGQDKTMLAALRTDASAHVLYSPQYAVGGPWRTTLTLINLDSVPGSATLSLYGENGSRIGSDRTVSMAASGKVLIDDPAFFGSLGEGVVQGYVQIAASSIRLTGSVEFGDSQDRSFRSALPLVSTLQNSVLFGHVASNDLYFTGLALLNPNGSDASATILLYGADGGVQKLKQIAIPARQRKSGLLTEFFPELIGQDRTSGYVKVTVDKGVAGFALFGTTNLSVLSAIPAQTNP
jgi:hypothetical protein